MAESSGSPVVTVIGAGMGGVLTSAMLGQAGCKLRLHDLNDARLADFRKSQGIEVEGANGGFAPMEMATTDLKAAAEGTDIFANDKVQLVWVDQAELDGAGLSEEQKRLYNDFGIRRGERLGCPVNFNNLTPGWYLNEPGEGEEASVRVDADLSFRAARDIAPGEELSIVYSEFSDS